MTSGSAIGVTSEPVLSLPRHLAAVLEQEFEHPARAAELLARWLPRRRYEEELAGLLVAVARGEHGDRWPVRRLATLLLEHLALALEPGEGEKALGLLARLDLAVAVGGGWRLRRSVLAEGFSTTELRPFWRQLQRRLGRLERVHAPLRDGEIPAAALRDFIRLSRRDCRLTLGRYLFTPDEVAERIFGDVRVSSGVRSPFQAEPPEIGSEADRQLGRLPDFEARLLRRLVETARIYWVSERTSSEPNSLVEYPQGTVVLVVKPPGSDHELEIKRAGLRGDRPLGAVFARDRRPVPPSHRLDGGSGLWNLHFEAEASAVFGAIFRRIHGVEAPISTVVAISAIHGIPGAGGEHPMASYFTEAERFGGGYATMRRAMARSVAACDRERGWSLDGLAGELGLSVRFLNQTNPAQAILAGSSSFRLDRLAAELGAGDPPADALPAGDREATRQRADEILDEVLGVYTPPRTPFRDRRSYGDAALELPPNRARADVVYRSLIRQIGRFWGTLLGLRGYSSGESFVARNVGLRSVWRRGRWRVEIRFQDHDNLNLSGRHGDFRPWQALPAMQLDEEYVVGGPGEKGELGWLEEVYRIGPSLRAETGPLLRVAVREAYRRTQQAVIGDPAVRGLFDDSFVARLRDWDEVVRTFLAAGRGEAERDAWSTATRRMLAGRGYAPELIDEYLENVGPHADFLARCADLFQPPPAGG